MPHLAHRSRTRRLAWIGALLLLTIAVLMTYQAIGQDRDARRYPPPGTRYTIGDQQIHLRCMGQGSPTVILEALAGGFSSYWAWVQPQVAQQTRVCAYDRPGLGWSTPGPHPADGAQVAATLRALLQAADEPGPYILVGHSIGALYVRHFAAAYPDEVRGLVLIDGSHPQQFIRNPALLADVQRYARLSALFAPLARLGIARAYFDLGGRLDFGDLPPQAQHELIAAWSSPRFFTNRRSEDPTAIYPVAAAQLAGLGDLPLVVLSADTSQSDSDFWANPARRPGRALHPEPTPHRTGQHPHLAPLQPRPRRPHRRRHHPSGPKRARRHTLSRAPRHLHPFAAGKSSEALRASEGLCHSVLTARVDTALTRA